MKPILLYSTHKEITPRIYCFLWQNTTVDSTYGSEEKSRVPNDDGLEIRPKESTVTHGHL